MNWIENAISLAVGLICGYILQRMRYRHERKVEIKQKVGRPIDLVFPLVTKLLRDTQYLVSSLQADTLSYGNQSLTTVRAKVGEVLEEFNQWYEAYGAGLVLELEFQDKELLASLRQILMHSNLAKDKNYSLTSDIAALMEDLTRCKDRIERFYKQL